MTNNYECSFPCNTIFNEQKDFQQHSAWHDQNGMWGRLECHLCGWHVEGEVTSEAVTMHLFNIKHTVNVAKKLSSFK